MKLRIRLLCLALALCLCLAACGTGSADPTTQATTQVTTEATTEATAEATAGSTQAPTSTAVSGKSIQNIILIIGDGMGLEHIEAGQLYDGETYGFTSWQTVQVNTAPMDYSGELSQDATDSAASATAMATGNLTVNNAVGVLVDRTELTTILDEASAMGKATGIVTTDQLFGATPAGFSAHSLARTNRSLILETQMDSGVNLLCGDLHQSCTVLQPQLEERGYAYCDNYFNLNSTFYGSKAYWQLPLAGNDAQLSLVDVSQDALSYLDQDPDGFVLVIEQAHIDKYSHNKEFLDTCKAVSNLNDTVEAVMAWLGGRTDTAVLVTADHECGGLVVSSEAGSYANTLEGPNGAIYYEYRNGGHTSANVALYVSGVTVDFTKFEVYSDQVLKNTGVYYLMSDILNTGK